MADEESKENYQAQVVPEIYDPPNDSKIVSNVTNIVTVDNEDSIATTNKFYQFYAATSSFQTECGSVFDGSGLPKEMEYRYGRKILCIEFFTCAALLQFYSARLQHKHNVVFFG